MNTRAEKGSWLPAFGWWVMTAIVIATGLITNWFIAAGVLVFLMIQVHRPFDFIATTLLVTAGSTFVYYEGGNLTLQLSLLTCAIVLMLLWYLFSNREQLSTLAWSKLSVPILAYVVLSLANAARGFLVGHPIKSVLFELLPVFGLSTTFLIANGFDPKRDLRLVVVTLAGIAFGSASLGFYVFSIIHTHTAGVFFSSFPGIVALLFINLSLRSRRLVEALFWILLSLPLYLHQFLSFRRGLWVGGVAGLITSALIFAGGRTRTQWSRVGLVVGVLLAVGAAGAISLEVFYGQTDILKESLGRVASIGSTELTAETKSNVIRLIETAGVIKLIRQSPVIGHGLGFTFIVPIPMQGRTRPQWWMDENYFLVWLKQGLIGLMVFVWMLWTALWFGARQARQREDPWEASWFATMGAGTAFMFLFCISDWPFTQVGTAFLFALLFGVSIAMARDGSVRFVWSPRAIARIPVIQPAETLAPPHHR